MKKLALIFGICLICLIVMAGCVRAEQLLPEQRELCLAPGDSTSVSVQVLPEKVKNKNLLWTVDDETVACVDMQGKITAQSAGDCTVTVRSVSNAEIFAQIGVTVLPRIERIDMQKELTLKSGQTENASVEIFPDKVWDDSVTWMSSDETVATVDENGTVTAVKAGTCTVTVRSIDVPEVFAAVDVTVLSVPRSILTKQVQMNLWEGTSAVLAAAVMPEDAYDRTLLWESSDIEIAEVDPDGNVQAHKAGECIITACSAVEPDVKVEIAVTVTVPYSYAGYPVSGLTYCNGILIANKTYDLPFYYNPWEDPQAMTALDEMFHAAEQEGIILFVKSGFRTYNDQYIIYNDWVALDGQEEADRYSARPGHSEHQSGLAFDLNDVSQAFADSPEGIWLAENCHKYGFIIRYPQDKEHITGYIYEPWHVRYLGKELAQKVYESGLCLEEYLGITSQYAE